MKKNVWKTISAGILAGMANLIALIVGGMVLPVSRGLAEAAAGAGGFFWIVLHSMLVGFLTVWTVRWLRGRGLVLFVAAFSAIWAITGLLNGMEVYYFRAAFPIFSNRDLSIMPTQEAIKAALTVATAMLATRKVRGGSEEIGLAPWPSKMILKAVLAILVYPFVYYGFGLFAWSFKATQELYASWVVINPGLVNMLLFQLLRGAVWVGIAVMVVRLAGTRKRAMILLPVLFVGGTALSLIVPNPFMPAMVRLAHGIELTLSMTLIGASYAWVFTRSRTAIAEFSGVSSSLSLSESL